MKSNLNQKNKHFFFYSVVFVGILFIDQVSKWLAVQNLPLHENVPLTYFFNLFLTYNKGVSFSLFSNSSPYGPLLLSLMSFIISLGVLYWLVKEEDKTTKFGLLLIFSGAISNIIDRVFLGHVVDFLDVYYNTYHWPAFNFADSFICLGAFIIFTRIFFNREKEQK